MCDFAVFLCCLNNNNIYCLEYSCLIISLLISPSYILGLLSIKWDLVTFLCEIFYSINITVSIFVIFIISIVIYSTKFGKITTNDFNISFLSLSIITIFIFIYLFLSNLYCSIQIFKDYIDFKNNKNNNYVSISSSLEKKKLKIIIKLKSTWICLSISTLLPTILSFINILLWISIYYRISFKIYCSFNKIIRKELREQKKNNKQFIEFKENSNTEKNIDKNKDKNNQNLKNIITVVIEKDRHPGENKILSNGRISTKNNIKYYNKQEDNNNKIKNNGEYCPSDFVSSERNIQKSNNNRPISE